MTHPRCRWPVLLLLLLWAGTRPARAEEAAPPTSQAAAEEVVKAVEAGDAPALAALAARDAPDPWIVADVLCAQDRHGAALAFAKAAPRAATKALPAAVRAQEIRRPARVRAAIEALRKTSGAKDWEAAARVSEGLKDEPTSLAFVRLEFERARVLSQLRRFAQAEATWLATARGAKELGWITWERRSWHEAGFAAFDDRRPDDAIAHWEHALPLLERLGDTTALASTLDNLSEVARRIARTDDALRFATRAVGVWRGVDEPRELLTAILKLGRVQERLSRHADARTSYEEARSLAVKHQDARGQARALSGLAAIDRREGAMEKARTQFLEARALFERSGDVSGVATTLQTLAAIEADLGRVDEAIRIVDEGIALLERVKGTRMLGGAFLSRGGLHQRLGDYERAEADYARALEVARATTDRRLAAHVHTNLGMILHMRDDHRGSIAALEKALPLAKAISDARLVGHIHLRLANAYRYMQDYEPALEHGTQGLAIVEAAHDQPGLAMALNGLGATWLFQNQPEKARPFYERAHAEQRETQAGHTYLWTLWGLGECAYADGQWRQALGLAHEAVALTETRLGGLDVQGGAVARDVWKRIFWLGQRAATHGKDAPELFWFMESGRAGSLRESLANRGAILAATVPEPLQEAERRARQDVVEATARLARVRTQRRLTKVREAKDALDAAKRALDDVVVRIQREARRGASVLYPQPDPLDHVQARLAAHEALVLYALNEPTSEAVALVVSRTAARIVPLAKGATLEEAATAFQPSDAERDDHDARGKALRDLLVTPLALPKGVTRVYVSPAGGLGYIPFAMLLARDVVYVPSATVHGLLHEMKTAPGEGVLALGDPDYGVATGRRAASPHRGSHASLPSLPATRDEVEAVGTVRLLGREATEAGFAKRVASRPRWRAVHFACHGLIDPASPQFSSLALTADAQDDGFLTSLEVYRLRIPADLVVLSACETARGRVLQNEGIIGFLQPFMVSGASRVLCSLWKVDDEATQALMVKFYELWDPADGTGRSAAEALRAAQQHVRSVEHEVVDREASRAAGRTVTRTVRRWAHPAYWAAWVLWGLP